LKGNKIKERRVKNTKVVLEVFLLSQQEEAITRKYQLRTTDSPFRSSLLRVSKTFTELRRGKGIS